MLAAQKKLFLLIGQSNMAGRADIEIQDTATLNSVFVLNTEGGFESAKNPLNAYSNIRKGISEQALGPGYTFGRTLQSYFQDSVYLIINARGGAEISQFLKGNNTGYYQSTLDRINQALSSDTLLELEAIIWHQGESDRDKSDSYLSKFRQLVKDYRTDLNLPDLPFIVGDLGHWNHEYTDIRQIIHQLPDSVANTYLVSTHALKNFDTHHFNSLAQRRLGRRYALKYLQVNHNSELAYIDSIICENEEVLGFSETGDYWLFDSDTTFLALEVKPDSIVQDVTICEGDSYFNLHETGKFIFQNTSSLGCDSTTIVNLEVNPIDTLVIDSVLIDLESYLGYTASGSYFRKFISSKGCDSLVNYNLTFTSTQVPLSATDEVKELFLITSGKIHFSDHAQSIYHKVLLIDFSGKKVKEQSISNALKPLKDQMNVLFLVGNGETKTIKLHIADD